MNAPATDTLSPRVGMREQVTVLLSGGIDSAACIAFYAERGATLTATFVDYGQAARVAESRAAKAVARHYGASVSAVRVDARRRWGAGLIPARNAMLVSCGLMVAKPRVQALVLGIHAGTSYVDCSPPFVQVMQKVADLYTDGRVQIAAPFLTWTKAEIARYCSVKRVPIHLTYSCEAGSQPCRRCSSCRDREGIDGA